MSLNREHAIVVLSGGQDSTTCLGWSLDRYQKVSCITFDYGQSHSIELKAALNVIEHFRYYYDREIHHEIVRLHSSVLASASPLTNNGEGLETYSSHEEMEEIIGDRVEKTFVPMRNALFLVLAANRAVAWDAGVIVTGVCQADNANYPDCRERFVTITNRAINEALGLAELSSNNQAGGGIEIQTPLMNLTKAQSIQLALNLPHTFQALKWSHTAYDGKYPPVGRDHASVLRAHGFEEARVHDPLVIRAWKEGLMDLPESKNYDVFRTGGR